MSTAKEAVPQAAQATPTVSIEFLSDEFNQYPSQLVEKVLIEATQVLPTDLQTDIYFAVRNIIIDRVSELEQQQLDAEEAAAKAAELAARTPEGWAAEAVLLEGVLAARKSGTCGYYDDDEITYIERKIAEAKAAVGAVAGK